MEQSFSSWIRPGNPHCCCLLLTLRGQKKFQYVRVARAIWKQKIQDFVVFLWRCVKAFRFGEQIRFFEAGSELSFGAAAPTPGPGSAESLPPSEHTSVHQFRGNHHRFSSCPELLTNPFTRFTVFTETKQKVFQVHFKPDTSARH